MLLAARRSPAPLPRSLATVGVLRAARRSPVPGRLAAPTPLGWASPADVYFSFDHKSCWRRGVVSFSLRHLVAWRSLLTGARVYDFPLHISSSLVVAPSGWFSRCTGWCGGLMPHPDARLDNAEPLRWVPDPRAHRAVRPRGRPAGDWPLGLPLWAGVCSGAGRLGTRDEGGDLCIPRGAPASLHVPVSRLPFADALAFCVGSRVRTSAGCPSSCWSLDRLGWTRSRNSPAALVCTAF